MNYNLLDYAFIPVIWSDGRADRVGIKTALAEAGSIRQIAASNPMDNVALLRFLLAVLYWCKGLPPNQSELEKILAAGQFPPDWFTKLDQHRDCFNLLGDGERFYQNQAYKNQSPEHTINYLIHEVPSGTNKSHFQHTVDFLNGLCPACCAMGLIRLPVFATSGGKGMSSSTGKSPGINSKPPLYVVPMGTTLAANLALSWSPTSLDLGTPEWETPGANLPFVGEVPLLNGLTWLPRSVWLADPEEQESVCVSCGRKERLIRRCVFDGKGSLKAASGIWRDPHVVYAKAKDGKQLSAHAGNALGAPDAAANQWARFLGGLLAEDAAPLGMCHAASTTSAITVSVLGFSSVQNDKYLEAWENRLTIHVSALADKGPNQPASYLELWTKEAMKCLAKAKPPEAKSSSRKHVELLPALAAIRPHIESRVSANISDLLSHPEQAWPKAAGEYGPMMSAAAKSLSPGFTTRALQRRNQIANVRPDMTPRPAPKPRKPKAKKGGDK